MESATEIQEQVVASEDIKKQTKSEKGVPFDALKICNNVVDNLPHRTSSKVTENYVDQLKKQRDDFKILRSSYSLKRAGKSLSKGKQEKLAKSGLSTDSITEDEAIISANLSNALYLTYRLIHETDPLAQIENMPKDLEYVDLGVRANIAFTNFFIDLHERYSVSEERLDAIFDHILKKTNLETDFRGRGLRGFEKGLRAAYKGYLYLANNKPGWKISTPDLVLDRDHGVDLVATSQETGEQHYYQIKGSEVNTVQLNDVTSDKSMEKVRKQIVLSPKPSSRNDLRSLGNIFDYINNLNRKGEKAKAIWMEVPV